MLDDATKQKIKPGLRLRVHEKAGGYFDGLVIARKHGSESGATFTVRGVIGDVGVEKIYPIHSPAIEKIKVLGKPKRVGRAKLYWVRGLSQKKIRKKLGVSL